MSHPQSSAPSRRGILCTLSRKPNNSFLNDEVENQNNEHLNRAHTNPLLRRNQPISLKPKALFEKEAMRIGAEKEARITAAQKKAERAREEHLMLVIDGKIVPTFSLTSTKITNSLASWYFANCQHFLYYEGCSIDDCSICLQPGTIGAKMSHLFCKHIFHTQCIEKWLMTNNKCPLCKKDFHKHKEYSQIGQMIIDRRNHKQWKQKQFQIWMKSIEAQEHQQQLKPYIDSALSEKEMHIFFTQVFTQRQMKWPVSLSSSTSTSSNSVQQIANWKIAHLLRSYKHFQFNEYCPVFNCDICLLHYKTNRMNILAILTILNCGHIFHFSCLMGWMKSNYHCPTCKSGFSLSYLQ